MVVENQIGNSYITANDARVAELADALASGASGRKVVGVQISSRALYYKDKCGLDYVPSPIRIHYVSRVFDGLTAFPASFSPPTHQPGWRHRKVFATPPPSQRNEPQPLELLHRCK